MFQISRLSFAAVSDLYCFTPVSWLSRSRLGFNSWRDCSLRIVILLALLGKEALELAPLSSQELVDSDKGLANKFGNGSKPGIREKPDEDGPGDTEHGGDD